MDYARGNATQGAIYNSRRVVLILSVNVVFSPMAHRWIRNLEAGDGLDRLFVVCFRRKARVPSCARDRVAMLRTVEQDGDDNILM